MASISSNQKIVKNSIAGVIRVIIVTPILFIIIPFMLNKLGVELYGIWALGMTVISFAQLSDLGLGRAVVRFVAQYSINSDINSINELLNTTLMAYLAIGLLVFVIVVPNINWITTTIFRIPLHLIDEAYTVVLGALVIFILNLIMGVFTYTLDGFQRMDLSNIINTLSVLLQSAGTFITLSLGWGLMGLIVGNISAILISGTIAIILVKKHNAALEFHPKFISFRALKTTLDYSLQVQTASIISIAFDPFTRILITNLCGLSYLSYYDIANKIIGNIRSVFLATTNPILPASAEYSSVGINKDKLLKIHFHSERYLLLAAPIMFFLSIVIMPSFIFLWIGREYSFAGLTFQIIAIGWLFSIFATPAFLIFAGIGRPKYQIYSQLILIISNVSLGFILGSLLGYFGIIVASTVSLIFATFYLLGSFAKQMGGGLEILPLKVGGISVLTASAVSILVYLLFKVLPINYLTLVAGAIFGVLAFFVVIGKAHIFNSNDIEILRILRIKGLALKFIEGSQKGD